MKLQNRIQIKQVAQENINNTCTWSTLSLSQASEQPGSKGSLALGAHAEAQRLPRGEPVTLSSAVLKGLRVAPGSKAATCWEQGGSKRAAPAAHGAKARPASVHMSGRLSTKAGEATPSQGRGSGHKRQREPGLTQIRCAACLSRRLWRKRVSAGVERSAVGRCGETLGYLSHHSSCSVVLALQQLMCRQCTPMCHQCPHLLRRVLLQRHTLGLLPAGSHRVRESTGLHKECSVCRLLLEDTAWPHPLPLWTQPRLMVLLRYSLEKLEFMASTKVIISDLDSMKHRIINTNKKQTGNKQAHRKARMWASLCLCKSNSYLKIGKRIYSGAKQTCPSQTHQHRCKISHNSMFQWNSDLMNFL